MKLISNKSFDTLLDVERFLDQINDGDSFQFSKDSINKRLGAMHDTARLQALVTLARRKGEKYLRFHEANDSTILLSELCDYAPGIAALRLMEGIQCGDQIISRRTALTKAQNKIALMDNAQFHGLNKGRCIDMICVSGAKLQYLAPLFDYRDSKKVKANSALQPLLFSLFKLISKNDVNTLEGNLTEACGVFAHELIVNTQEHATCDENGLDYVAHTEGVIVSWDTLDEKSYYQDFSKNPKLKEFWDREATPTKGGESRGLRCIQLSFFDSGPGLVGRSVGEHSSEIDIESEKNALIKCIQKNFTTKKQVGAGSGYPTILTQLSKVGGLIKIRSGRLNVFNSFNKDNHEEQVNESDKKQQEKYLTNFDDWDSSRVALNFANGAVVSILIPVRRESGQHSLL